MNSLIIENFYYTLFLNITVKNAFQDVTVLKIYNLRYIYTINFQQWSERSLRYKVQNIF